MTKVGNIPPMLRREGMKERLEKICKENDVVFLAIFGSFVRGEQKEKSDIDIAFKYAEGGRKSLLDLVRLGRELEDLFGRKVDIGEVDSINPYIIDDVKKEMKVVYEKG